MTKLLFTYKIKIICRIDEYLGELLSSTTVLSERSNPKSKTHFKFLLPTLARQPRQLHSAPLTPHLRPDKSQCLEKQIWRLTEK